MFQKLKFIKSFAQNDRTSGMEKVTGSIQIVA